jgi:DNA-binding NtrC family response regulator
VDLLRVLQERRFFRVGGLSEVAVDVRVIAATHRDLAAEEALRLLLDHSWPGNVRELENAIERALVTCKSGVLGVEDFAFLKHPAAGADSSALPPGLTLQELEKQYVAATLGRLSGNVKATAEALGIDRSTLYEKIKRYEIPR